MKLTRKEIALILAFLVAAVLAIGIFVFVVPVFQENEIEKKRLTELQAEWAQAQENLSRNLTIDAEIEAAYAEAKKQSDYFYPEMPIYDTDVVIRGLLKKSGIKVGSITISDFTTEDLSLSFFTPGLVTYPIKESADLIFEEVRNYAPPAEGAVDEAAPETEVVAEVPEEGSMTETVGAVDVSFNVSGGAPEIKKFMDVIDKLPQATYLRSINVPYETLKIGEDGEPTVSTEPITTGVSIVLYCVKPCVPPNVQPTVG